MCSAWLSIHSPQYSSLRRSAIGPPTVDAAGFLDRRARAHLVGDRADAADAGGDVRRLGVRAAAQERLEEAGRLVDIEPRFFDLVAAGPDVQGAFALHPGQFGDGQHALVLVGHLYGRFSR